jgi:phage protein U
MSIISTLIPDNAAEIALAKILALTPFQGIIGNVVFLTASFLGMTHVQTYDGLTRKSTARWVDHEIINGPPVSEFTGRSLKDMEFSITLSSTLHFDPLSTYETIEKMQDSGEPQLVFINGKNYGRYTVRSAEGEELYWAYGRPAVLKIALTLREYISALPTVAEQKLREDEIRRSDTGKGGPDRLPGNDKVDPVKLSKEVTGRVR